MMLRTIIFCTKNAGMLSRQPAFVNSKACFFCGHSQHQHQMIDTESSPGQQVDLVNQGASSSSRPLPVITSRKLLHPPPYAQPKQAWLESLATLEDVKLGILDLHPDVFGLYPRTDVVQQNVHWQRSYRRISYATSLSRAELPGGGRKPWPQKGTGRARHGSIRSPIWHKGGAAMGPRGPNSYFYMLSTHLRAMGLRSMLSIKFAQDDLHIVENLEIPMDDPEYLTTLADVRFWGDSVLFIDDNDVLPKNTAIALSEIPHFNAMPVYGLNVYSMLKHQTLVLTLAAVEKIEQKLLTQLHSSARERKWTPAYSPTPFVRDPVVED